MSAAASQIASGNVGISLLKDIATVGATNIDHAEDLGGVGHLMGAVRMGSDLSTSVAEGFGRTHDYDNLFISGSGLFPTTGTASPTLTIAALALRTASAIGDELGLPMSSLPVATLVS